MKTLINIFLCALILSACKGAKPVVPGDNGEASNGESTVGYFDGIQNEVGMGWAYVKGSEAESVPIQFFADGDYQTGIVIGTFLANKPRSDLNNALKIKGDHGFSVAVPEALKDGNSHQIHAYAVGKKGLVKLGNSPQSYRSAVVPCKTAGPLVPPEPNEFVVQIESANLNYLSAECGGDDVGLVTATATTPGEFETFYVSRREGGKLAIRTSHGRYLSAEGGGGGALHANRTTVGSWELFSLEGIFNDRMMVGFKSTNGHFLSTRFGAAPAVVSVEAPALGPWEYFTLHMQQVPHVDPMSFTLAQIRDLQGDLMLWVPELKPNYVGGVDPVTGIREIDDRGVRPRGLANGWVWTLNIDRYPKDKREIIYQAALRSGYTHFAVQVTHCEPSTGYHGLMPVDWAFCNGHDQLLNEILTELWDHRLIPLCTGVSPTDAVAPGLDRSLCRIVLNDWDNSDEADCHIKILAETFPDAQIVFELPESSSKPARDSCSPNPFPTTGGAWIRQAQQRWPNLFAVAYEISVVNGIEDNVAKYAENHAFWRDLQEIQFETDTYWKFWDNLGFEEQRRYNDEIKRRVPYLKGFMSGSSSHAPPSGEVPPEGGFVGELDPHQATPQHIAPGFADWPETTRITKLEITLTGVKVTLTNNRPEVWPDFTPPGWDGPLLYSYGIAEKINGVWHYSAPIQLWRGMPESGGPIQSQDVEDGTGRGQILANWFYSPSWWGPLASYEPQPGEVIGFFVCAGDCRDGDPSRSPVKERSNIVLFPLPAPGTSAVFQGQ